MKTVYLALGLLLLPGMLWAQGSEKENEFTMSMQIRPRAEYRNGAQLPRFEGDKAASFINNRARLSMEYKRSDLSMKISGTTYDGIYPTGLKVNVAFSTGINNVTLDSDASNCPIYNMNGQRVDGSYKGVVIQNGKKRLVK